MSIDANQTAVIYCRKSYDDGKSDSIESQKKECYKTAEALNCKVILCESDGISGRLYPDTDEGKISAESDIALQRYFNNNPKKYLKLREGLGRILKRIEEGGIDYLIIRDEDRLHRTRGISQMSGLIYKVLLKHHIKMFEISTSKIYDLSNDQDILILTLRSQLKDADIIKKQKLSSARKARMRDAGELYTYVGRILGIKQSKGKNIELIDEEVTIVRFIFDSYLKHIPIMTICDQLNEKYPKQSLRKTKKHSKAKTWHNRDIRRILSQMYYTGYWYDTNNSLRKINEFVGKEIIDLPTFLTIQDKLKATSVSNESTRIHPLNSKIYCGVCGKKMMHKKYHKTDSKSGHTSPPHWDYHCFTDSKRVNKQCNVRVRETEIAQYTSIPSTCLIEALRPLAFFKALERLKRQFKNSDIDEEIAKLEIEKQKRLEKSAQLSNQLVKLDEAVPEIINAITANRDLITKLDNDIAVLEAQSSSNQVMKLGRKNEADPTPSYLESILDICGSWNHRHKDIIWNARTFKKKGCNLIRRSYLNNSQLEFLKDCFSVIERVTIFPDKITVKIINQEAFDLHIYNITARLKSLPYPIVTANAKEIDNDKWNKLVNSDLSMSKKIDKMGLSIDVVYNYFDNNQPQSQHVVNSPKQTINANKKDNSNSLKLLLSTIQGTYHALLRMMPASQRIR